MALELYGLAEKHIGIWFFLIGKDNSYPRGVKPVTLHSTMGKEMLFGKDQVLHVFFRHFRAKVGVFGAKGLCLIKTIPKTSYHITGVEPTN